MDGRRLVFLGPSEVAVERFDAGAVGPGQLSVKTLVSAISAGTEGLLWKGTWPPGMSLDGSWNPDPGSACYPVCYGYAAVGEVEAVGDGVDSAWKGRLVFSFTGHQSCAIVPAENAILLPPGLAAEDGVFVAAMETALTLVQDAAPVVGETVGVWGLGTIGVLASALAGRSFRVKAWDASPSRRQQAEAFGIGEVERPAPASCDVSLELTGSAAALDEALQATLFSGRVIVGSWYGSGPTPVSLGGEFHRSRIQIVSSQVSTLSPVLSGRWTKKRRFETVLEAARTLRPSRLVTHRFGLDHAAEAYRQACDLKDGLQVVFTYG
jgi:2-desacetyl-2-hydroxyethyl bacteriochlorophyllide A dehydrogenase